MGDVKSRRELNIEKAEDQFDKELELSIIKLKCKLGIDIYINGQPSLRQKKYWEMEALKNQLRKVEDGKYVTFVTVSLYQNPFSFGIWEKLRKECDNWLNKFEGDGIWCLEQRCNSIEDYQHNHYKNYKGEEYIEGKGFHIHLLHLRNNRKPSYVIREAISKFKRFCNNQKNMIDVRFKNHDKLKRTVDYINGIKIGETKAETKFKMERVKVDKHMRNIYNVQGVYIK